MVCVTFAVRYLKSELMHNREGGACKLCFFVFFKLSCALMKKLGWEAVQTCYDHQCLVIRSQLDSCKSAYISSYVTLCPRMFHCLCFKMKWLNILQEHLIFQICCQWLYKGTFYLALNTSDTLYFIHEPKLAA